MSELYLCCCDKFYKQHSPRCPAKMQWDKAELVVAKLVHQLETLKLENHMLKEKENA